jgi:hypothetical protein
VAWISNIKYKLGGNKMYIHQNFWLGSNELIIVFRDGTCHVIEQYEDWETVFTGRYEECLKYCKSREIEYKESIIG